MKIPGGLMLESDAVARKDGEIPLINHTKGTRETTKGFVRQK